MNLIILILIGLVTSSTVFISISDSNFRCNCGQALLSLTENLVCDLENLTSPCDELSKSCYCTQVLSIVKRQDGYTRALSCLGKLFQKNSDQKVKQRNTQDVPKEKQSFKRLMAWIKQNLKGSLKDSVALTPAQRRSVKEQLMLFAKTEMKNTPFLNTENNNLYRKLYRVDPNVQMSRTLSPSLEFNQKSSKKKWRMRFWTAVISLQYALRRDNLDNIIAALGKWRHYVKLESVILKINSGLTVVHEDISKIPNFGKNPPDGYMIGTPFRGYRDAIVDIHSRRTVNDVGNFILATDPMNEIESYLKSFMTENQQRERTVYDLWSYLGVDEDYKCMTINTVIGNDVIITLLTRDEIWGVNTRNRAGMEAMKYIFNDIVEMNVNPRNEAEVNLLIKKVANFHYLVAHNNIWLRGSASFGEVMSAAFLTQKGLQWPGYKIDVMADVYALCTPNIVKFQNDYVSLLRNFPSLFNKFPIKLVFCIGI